MPFTITSCGISLVLDAERAIYIPDFQALVISDVHIGKASHFQKHGLAVPATVVQTDLQRLANLISNYNPTQVIITGDMFHSTANTECELFGAWRANFPHVNFILVKGNHDIIADCRLEALGLQIFPNHHCIGPFCFIHDAPSPRPGNTFAISGHLHPGIVLSGKARQAFRLPCFHFTQNYAILPAFSLFTGLSLIKPHPQDKVYAIAGNRVIAV